MLMEVDSQSRQESLASKSIDTEEQKSRSSYELSIKNCRDGHLATSLTFSLFLRAPPCQQGGHAWRTDWTSSSKNSQRKSANLPASAYLPCLVLLILPLSNLPCFIVLLYH